MKANTSALALLRLSLTLVMVAATVAISRADGAPRPCALVDTAPSSYRDAIKSAYDQMTMDFIDNHIDQSAVFMTDDYRQIDPQGHTLDKSGSRKKFQWERNQINTVATKCSIDSISVEPDGVHVEMATHSYGKGFKRVLFVNMKGSFTNDLHVKDLWVSTPDGWRLKYRQMLQDESHVSAG